MNAYYGSLEKRLDAHVAAKLHTAQLAWINYKVTNCEAEAAYYEGGSIQPAMHFGCLERVRARIVELHTIYDSENR